MNRPPEDAATRAPLAPASAGQPRRAFLQGIAAVTTAAAVAPQSMGAWRADAPLVDVNVSLGNWPFRRVPLQEPAALVSRLRQYGVRQSWTGDLEALWHKDLARVNARLVDSCHRHGRGMLVPFGSVNPAQPDWREELHRCARQHRMRGLRLHPNYHGYTLDDPRFAELLDEAARMGLVVQLSLVMEDERMMHPLARVAPVDPAPLAALVKARPALRVVLLNALRTLRAKPLLELIATEQVFVEIAMLEGVGGLEALLGQVPHARVLFGSHAPLFYFESAWFKLKESDPPPAKLRAIRSENARRLLESLASRITSTP